MICEYETCDKPVKVAKAGLCSGHYQQQWKGQQLRPLMEKKLHLRKDVRGRVCSKCMTYKPWDQFYVRNGGVRESVCKPCYLDAVKAYQQSIKSR